MKTILNALSVLLLVSFFMNANAQIKSNVDLRTRALREPVNIKPGGSGFVKYQLRHNLYKGSYISIPSSTTDFYLSKDITLDSSDVRIKRQTLQEIKTSGETIDSTLIEIPTTLDTGSYVLITVTDALNQVMESDEENNIDSSGVFVGYRIAPSPYNIKLSNHRTDTVLIQMERTHTTVIKLQNTGNFIIHDQTIGIFLSKDSTFDAQDEAFAPMEGVINLYPKTTQNHGRSLYFNLRDSIKPGIYYIIQVADLKNEHKEFNENDNIAYFPVKVPVRDLDLVTNITSLKKDTLISGDTLKISATTENIGKDYTINPFFVEFFISFDTIFNRQEDHLLGHKMFGPGWTGPSDYSLDVKIPTWIYPGNHYIIAVTDNSRYQIDINLGNNITSQLLIVEPATLDLVTGSPKTNTIKANIGDTLSVSATVSNTTIFPSLDFAYLSIVLSDDSIYSADDVVIKTSSDKYDSKAVNEKTFDFTVPDVNSKVVYIISKVVYNGPHNEDDTLNNVAFTPIEIGNGTVTSVNNKETISINAFPNPVTDKLTIKVNGFNDEPVSISVTDPNGIIYTTPTFSINKFSQELNFENFKAGLYFVNVSRGNHYNTVKVFKK